jgi:hypothetical protein
MTDIVERLRMLARDWDRRDVTQTVDPNPFTDAADEIEHLRDLLTRLGYHVPERDQTGSWGRNIGAPLDGAADVSALNFS